jgi:hypothetical protein
VSLDCWTLYEIKKVVNKSLERSADDIVGKIIDATKAILSNVQTKIQKLIETAPA